MLMTENLAIRYAVVKRFAKEPLLPSYSDPLEHGDMDTNAEIRRRRLAELCATEGGVRAVATAAGMNWQSLDQILKAVLLPAKADGTRVPKALGDDAARRLEEVFNLGRGWFDWPFEGIDFKKWAVLNDFQRAMVQGRMVAAIEEALQKNPKVLHHAAKKAVTNQKVEKHFKALPAGAAEAARRRAHTSAKVPTPSANEPELPLRHRVKGSA